ncbi:MAG: hypothetical protein ACE5JX_16395 [Acidobacteriota bacterium]
MNRPEMLLISLLGFSTTIFAQSGEESAQLILPIVANGVVGDVLHFQSTFNFLNLSNSTAEGLLQVYDNGGELTTDFLLCTPVPTPDPSVKFPFTPGSSIHHTGITDTPLLSGWGRLTWETSARIEGSVEVTLINAPPHPCLLVCTRPSSEIVSTTQVPGVRPAKEFRFPVIITENRHSAFALVNPSNTETARISLTLLDSLGQVFRDGDGNRAQIEEYFMAPFTRVSQFAWDFFDACDPQHQICTLPVPTPAPDLFHGSIQIKSDIPIAVGGLHVLFPEGKIVGLPVETIDSSGS